MEQNRGFTFAIGLVALVLGVVLGLAICGSGTRVQVATVGKDFRAGQPYYRDYYEYRGGLNASAYDSFSRNESVRYEYYERPETVIFRSTDCTNIATINRFQRELDLRGWQDFANFCASAGYPLG